MLEDIYITIAILITLMFLDYFLTLKGFKLYKKRYSKYVEVESYELNPKLKYYIKEGKYSFGHLMGVILVSAIVYGFHYIGRNNLLGLGMWVFFLIQGMLFSIFVYLNSIHIQNIIIFNAVNKNPSMLSGKLKRKYLFSLKAGSARALEVFLILLFVFIMVPNSFTLGFALGPLVMLLKLRCWVKK